jgi:hypothetical protein
MNLAISRVDPDFQRWLFVHEAGKKGDFIRLVLPFETPYKGCDLTYGRIIGICTEYTIDPSQIVTLFRYTSYKVEKIAGKLKNGEIIRLSCLSDFPELQDLAEELEIPGFYLGLQVLVEPGYPPLAFISAIRTSGGDDGDDDGFPGFILPGEGAAQPIPLTNDPDLEIPPELQPVKGILVRT